MMNKEKDKEFENSLMASEEGRAIRLYLAYHPFAFENVLLGGMDRQITERELNSVFDIFGFGLDDDEIMNKIFHGRLELLLMYLEELGMVKIIERKDGLTELMMEDSTNKYIRKIIGV